QTHALAQRLEQGVPGLDEHFGRLVVHREAQNLLGHVCLPSIGPRSRGRALPSAYGGGGRERDGAGSRASRAGRWLGGRPRPPGRRRAWSERASPPAPRATAPPAVPVEGAA